MKRLLRLAARIYPASWRDRYGIEFQALLEETKPRWSDILDVLNGGLQMRVRRTHPALTMAAFGILGALGAGATAFSTADRFASTGTVTVRPWGPSTTTSETTRLDDAIPRLTRAAFSRDNLMGIIERYDLYRSERAQSSVDSLINRMRGDIGIQLISQRLVQVSFTSAEARQSQQVARDLVSELVEANLHETVGVVQVIDLPDESVVSVSPRRVAAASLGGLVGGALIGTLIALVLRRPTQPAS